jgi:hypothetical protein
MSDETTTETDATVAADTQTAPAAKRAKKRSSHIDHQAQTVTVDGVTYPLGNKPAHVVTWLALRALADAILVGGPEVDAKLTKGETLGRSAKVVKVDPRHQAIAAELVAHSKRKGPPLTQDAALARAQALTAEEVKAYLGVPSIHARWLALTGKTVPSIGDLLSAPAETADVAA